MNGPLDRLLQQIRRTADAAPTDGDLLAQYTANRHEAAFAEIVRRHGRMVLAVCRSVLRDPHDAEDAYQATFLALARRAASVNTPDAVGAWLHTVAVNASVRLRERKEARKFCPLPETDNMSTDEMASGNEADVLAAMNVQILTLPEKYRQPLVLCGLQGISQDRAAQQLGVSLRTLSRLLERGRYLLRQRLLRQGITLSVGILLARAESASAAGVPAELAHKTVKSALAFAADPATAPAELAALANGAPGARLSGFFLGVLVSGSLLAGAVGLAAWYVSRGNGPPVQTHRANLIADAAPQPANRTSEPAEKDGAVARIAGRILDAEGKPLANADVTFLARRPFQPGEHGLRDDVVAHGKTDPEGRFRLTAPADFPSWYGERRVTILAYAAGHAPQTLQVPLQIPASDVRALDTPVEEAEGAGEPAVREVMLRLSQGESAKGKLLDPDGQPASGVLLRVVRLGDAACERIQGAEPAAEPAGWPKPVTTDAEGCFELLGLEKKNAVWLQVDDDRYSAQGLRVMPGEPVKVVMLSEGMALEGRVVAADTGEPMADARLTVVSGIKQSNAVQIVSAYQDTVTRQLPLTSFDVRTGRDGHFRFRAPPGETIELEVHAPQGVPYLSVRQNFCLKKNSVPTAAPTILLPRGVLVHGELVDARSGKRIPHGHVTCDVPVRKIPGRDAELLFCSRALVRADADGRFTVVAPAAVSRLLAYGPTQDFIARRHSRWVLGTPDVNLPRQRESPQDALQRWTLEPERHNATTAYAHSEFQLDLHAGEKTVAVRMELRRGRTIEGELLDPEGKPVKSAVMLCAGRVGPVWPITVLPLEVRDGHFVLPGCEEGNGYTIMFLDSAHDCGAVARVRCLPDSAPARVQLQPCGQAKVRIVDDQGLPITRYRPSFWVRTPRSNGLDDLPPAPLPFDRHEDLRIDPVYMKTLRHSDADGWVHLPRLIPGVEYQLGGDGENRAAFLLPPFTVRPSELRTLPNIVLRRQPAEFKK